MDNTEYSQPQDRRKRLHELPSSAEFGGPSVLTWLFRAGLCVGLFAMLLPTVTFAAEEKSDAEPHAALLKLFKEPSIRPQVLAGSTKAIRLIFLSTFSAPVSVHAYLTPQGPRLRGARLSGKAGYDLGTLAFQNEFPLAKEHWEKILQLSSPKKARKPLEGVTKDQLDALASMDGSTWILEVRDGTHYFDSPVENPTMLLKWQQEGNAPAGIVVPDVQAFVALCRYLLQFAPMDESIIN